MASSPTDRVTAYANNVVDGRIVAGPQVRAACRRHLRDLEHGAERGLVWSIAAAGRAIAYFESVLRLNGGQFEGLPFLLQPWQAFIVGSLFGWLRASEDGPIRRFRTAFVLTGKGNGKSPLAAGIGLYCLTSDRENRAEVYAAATKKDQAMILFRDAVAMRDQSPDLRSRLTKFGGVNPWNLSYPATGSFFRAISSDDGQSGPRPHCSLIDEIHEHPNATVVNMLAAGVKGRRQPLTVEITNAGVDRTSVCFDHAEYSRRVAAGEITDDEWFAYVCALDEDDQPHDPEKGPACWIKANPNLGVSIRPDYVASQVAKASGLPSFKSTVDRLNFCTWVGADAPWIDGRLWIACEHEFDDVMATLAECDEVVGGIDLSGARDLTALGLSGRLGDALVARVEFWTPGDTLVDRAARDRVPYDVWRDHGYLNTTPGRAVDYRWVAQRIAELQVALPNFRRIAFDSYRIKYLEVALAEANVEIELIPHPQGYYQPKVQKDAYGDEMPQLWMPRSVELLEAAVMTGTLRVERNPALTWNSSNAVLKPDPKSNRIFDKRISRGRIDGIVALAMSLGLSAEAPDDDAGDADGFFSNPIMVGV